MTNEHLKVFHGNCQDPFCRVEIRARENSLLEKTFLSYRQRRSPLFIPQSASFRECPFFLTHAPILSSGMEQGDDLSRYLRRSNCDKDAQ